MELFRKLPRLCFFLHIGLTEILGFLDGDGLWDDIEKEEVMSWQWKEEGRV